MTEKKLQCSLWLPGFRRLLAVKMHFPLSPNKGDGLPVLYTASLPDGLLSELSPSCAPLGEARQLGWILGKCGLHVVNLSWYNSPSSHVRSAPKFTISRRERSGILSAFQLPFSSSTPHSSVNSNFIQACWDSDHSVHIFPRAKGRLRLSVPMETLLLTKNTQYLYPLRNPVLLRLWQQQT